MYETILLVVFLLAAIAIIGLVLVQNGKGAGMGASFGAGASATLFGSGGTGNFLTRLTSILGLVFFIVSIALANFNSSTHSDFSNLEKNDDEIGQILPATEKKSVVELQQVSPTSEIPE